MTDNRETLVDGEHCSDFIASLAVDLTHDLALALSGEHLSACDKAHGSALDVLNKVMLLKTRGAKSNTLSSIYRTFY